MALSFRRCCFVGKSGGRRQRPWSAHPRGVHGLAWSGPVEGRTRRGAPALAEPRDTHV